MKPPPFLKSPALSGFRHVKHGFFTAEGGVSDGPIYGNNCGFGADDDPDAVQANRDLSMIALGVEPQSLTTVYQRHTPEVVLADATWTHDQAPVADGMVSKTPGVTLGILTADCAPVLLFDPDARVIGAAHAGWRGAVGGVLENTVEAMEVLGASAENIHAAIGPTIFLENYEVGDEFRETVLKQDQAAAPLFAKPSGSSRWHFDLPAYVVMRLERAGVGDVAPALADTYPDPDQFFSYRRSCHREKPDYGRHVSAISLVA